MNKEKFRFFALILILITICFILYSPKIVSADGGFFVDFGEHIYVPSQKAAIFWDGFNETMVISTKINSTNISDMAWVLPIQSSEIPEVSKGNAEIFNKIAYSFGEYSGGGLYYNNYVFFFLFVILIISIIFLIGIFLLKKIKLLFFIIFLSVLIIIASFSLFIYIYSSGMMASSSYDDVELMEMKTVDFYDIAVLKATNATNLVDWLDENEFIVPEKSIPVLQKYCDQENYYFIVNKIDMNNSEEISESISDHIKSKIEEMITIYENISDLNINYFEIPTGTLKHEALSLSYITFDIFTADPYYSALSNVHDLFKILNLTEEKYTSLSNEYRIDTNLSEGLCNYDKIICDPYEYCLRHSMTADLTILYMEEGKQKQLYLENKYTYEKETINLEDDYWKTYYGYGSLNESEIKFLIDSAPKLQTIYHELGLIKDKSDNLKLCLSCYEIEQEIIDIIENFSRSEGINIRGYGDFAKYTELNENNMYDGSFVNNSIKYCIDTRNNIIQQELREGIATPLEIKFQPEIPMYPMKMTSINDGDTKINVYFISDYYVNDSSGLLNTKGKNRFYWPSYSPNYNAGDYLTWMTFEGNTKDLTDDSYFV